MTKDKVLAEKNKALEKLHKEIAHITGLVQGGVYQIFSTVREGQETYGVLEVFNLESVRFRWLCGTDEPPLHWKTKRHWCACGYDKNIFKQVKESDIGLMVAMPHTATELMEKLRGNRRIYKWAAEEKTK
jgi:hypothetical protein